MANRIFFIIATSLQVGPTWFFIPILEAEAFPANPPLLRFPHIFGGICKMEDESVKVYILPAYKSRLRLFTKATDFFAKYLIEMVVKLNPLSLPTAPIHSKYKNITPPLSFYLINSIRR
jgi:hypothetical protein